MADKSAAKGKTQSEAQPSAAPRSPAARGEATQGTRAGGRAQKSTAATPPSKKSTSARKATASAKPAQKKTATKKETAKATTKPAAEKPKAPATKKPATKKPTTTKATTEKPKTTAAKKTTAPRKPAAKKVAKPVAEIGDVVVTVEQIDLSAEEKPDEVVIDIKQRDDTELVVAAEPARKTAARKRATAKPEAKTSRPRRSPKPAPKPVEPTIEPPAVAEPVAEEVVLEQAPLEEVAIEPTIVESPVIKTPIVEEPIVEETIVEEEAIVEEPAVETYDYQGPAIAMPAVPPPAIEEPDLKVLGKPPEEPEIRLEEIAQAIAGSMTAHHEQRIPRNVRAIPRVLPDKPEEEEIEELAFEPEIIEAGSRAVAYEPRGYQKFVRSTPSLVESEIDIRHSEVDAELQELSEPPEPLILQVEPQIEEPVAQRKVEVPPRNDALIETIPTPQRFARSKAKIVTVVVSAGVFLTAGLALGSRSGQHNNSTGNSSVSVSTVTSPPVTGNPGAGAAPAPGAVPGGNVAMNLSGSTNRQSALFDLAAGAIKVHYNTTGGNLTVRLLPQSGNDNGDDFMCTSACDREADLIATSGKYYLDVQSSGGGNWNVQVTQ